MEREGATSLRERNREQNRAVTAETAWRLFMDRGYDDVTVADICAAAAIAPRTFHRYFNGKEDVLAEPVRRMAAVAQEAIAAAPADAGDAAAMAEAIRALGRFVVDNHDWVRALVIVSKKSHHVRAEHVALRPDEERGVAALLAARHDDARHDDAVRDDAARDDDVSGEPDWRLRLLVAHAIAVFRVWLDDYFHNPAANPMAHLDEMLRDPWPG